MDFSPLSLWATFARMLVRGGEVNGVRLEARDGAAIRDETGLTVSAPVSMRDLLEAGGRKRCPNAQAWARLHHAQTSFNALADS